MIYARMEDPPEHLQAEANALRNEYLGQFDDDNDEFPEGVDPVVGFHEFLLEHGSKELIEYVLKVQKAREEALKDGIMI